MLQFAQRRLVKLLNPMRRWFLLISLGIIAAFSGAAIGARAADLPVPGAQEPIAKAPAFVPSPANLGEWYFEFGSDKEFWSNPNIHVSQPALGNNFTIYNVVGHDAPAGAGEAPQFNIRFGRFLNENWGVELSLDHSKFYTDIGQIAQVKGVIGGVPLNAPTALSSTFFTEQLHNGANHIMLAAVYRYPLIGQTNETNSLAAIGKVDVGMMLPHTSDTILGNPVNVGVKAFNNLVGVSSGWWQLNGWTTGFEIGLRYTVFKPFYLELTNKVAYSDFLNLPAFQGTMQQSMWMDEIVLTVGFTFDGTSTHPLWW